MLSIQDTVFVLWCRLTGNDPTDFGDEEREAFLARPQVIELAHTPYPLLLDAGIRVVRRGSLRFDRSTPSAHNPIGRRLGGVLAGRRALGWPALGCRRIGR